LEGAVESHQASQILIKSIW